MTNSTEHEPKALAPDAASRPSRLPHEDAEAARERWRRIGLRLGEIAETEVDKLRDIQCSDEQEGASGVNPTIRAISQVVITSLRAMEMEDSYDRKTGGGNDAERAERKRRARERADRLERKLKRKFAAGGDAGGSEKKDSEE